MLYSLPFEDYIDLVKALDLDCAKEKMILKIWKSGNPIHVVKAVNSGNPAAVKFAEFAVLETTGTMSLTNKNKGASNFVPNSFSKSDVMNCGIALLVESYTEKIEPISVFKDSFNTQQNFPVMASWMVPTDCRKYRNLCSSPFSD